MKNKLLLFLLQFITLYTIAQTQSFPNKELNIGDWKLHVPYQKGKIICKAENRIYVLAVSGIYYLDILTKKTKILDVKDGYSGYKANQIAYSEKYKALIIAYEDLSIDIVKNDKVYTLTDLKDKIITGNKIVNKIRIIGDDVFLVCGFALIKVNVNKNEFGDTYYINPSGQNYNLNDIQVYNNYYYVSSDSGLYKIETNNPLISDYKEWKRETFTNNISWGKKQFKNMVICHNRLYIQNYSTAKNLAYDKDTIIYLDLVGNWTKPIIGRNNDINIMSNIDGELIINYFNFYDFAFVYDEQLNFKAFGIYSPPLQYNIIDAVSDGDNGLILLDQFKGLYKTDKSFKVLDSFPLKPNGTFFEQAFRMNFIDTALYVNGGGYSESGFTNYAILGTQRYKNFEWQRIFVGEKEIPNKPFHSVTSYNINPKDNKNKFVTSWGSGIMEIKNNNEYTIYNKENTENALQEQPGFAGFYAHNNSSYDTDNNIWFDNSLAPKPIIVRTKSGKWKSLSVGVIGRTKQLLIDKNGLKWLLFAANQGIAILDDNKTPLDESDDVVRLLNANENNGALNTLFLNSITEDINGDVWVGTDKGIYVCYNTSNILEKNNNGTFNDYQAQQIKINTNGTVEYLLETEAVTCIIIDKANRKWIGTKSSGVYCVNENGTKQLYHFTTEDSPLLSNDISSLAINDFNGEIFIGTSFGVQSFKAETTIPSKNCDEIFTYPNPITKDYQGNIIIKNVLDKSSISILDITGNLIARTTSLGGQAFWDGKTTNGERTPPGIYIAIVLNDKSNKGCKTKLMILD